MSAPFPRPLILGHRGAPLEAPENSLRSFALALEQGADGVELDVQRSSDGVPVVIHDETLERTMAVEGAVAARSWTDLSRLTGGGEPLPSLEQVATWAAGSGAWLNVEIKSGQVEEATLAVLERAGVLERTLLSSFSPRIVQRIGELAPGALRFLLTETWHEGTQEAAVTCGAQGICLRVDAASHLVLEVLRQEGYPVVVWTVDSPVRMRELLRWGVAGLITNRPALGVAARAEVV